MKLTELFPKNNKKGMTLIEIVAGVVVLSIFALGVITALSVASTKIANNSNKSAIVSEATMVMDAVIAAASHGGSTETMLKDNVKNNSDFELIMTSVTYEGTDEVRGWKLKLTYNGEVIVTGYASNTKGAFDRNDE